MMCEELDATAKRQRPESLWYELQDFSDETPDQELLKLIARFKRE